MQPYQTCNYIIYDWNLNMMDHVHFAFETSKKTVAVH